MSLRSLAVDLSTRWRRGATRVDAFPLPPRFAKMTAPTLEVFNEAYQTDVFRKMHVEYARGREQLEGVEVVHSTIFPRFQFDLPILGTDVIMLGGAVTYCIADASLVAPSPGCFHQTMATLQRRHGLSPVAAPEDDLPEWAREVFSPGCVVVRRPDDGTLAAFRAYVLDLTDAYLEAAARVERTTADHRGVRAAQARYCVHQLRNDKTRGVLRKAFDAETADAYMREVMFDVR
jgi:phycocyanobilin:ferredoxin oxidoreductase